MADYDAIIIGAGHNGLTTAGYLAKEGLKTLVVEKREVVGGACVTEEIEPGFKFNLGATGFASWLRPEVMKDLELERFGLETIPLNPMYTSPFPDGEYLSLYADLDDAHREIERFSVKDADAYVEFMRRWESFKNFLDPALMNPPAPLPDLVGAMASSPEMLEMLRLAMFGELKKGLDDTFESEYLKSTLLVLSLDGSHLGPTATSMGMFILHLCMTPSWRVVKGGVGVISQVMAKVFEHFGGTIKTGATVGSILIENGKAIGVKLSTGEEITAKVVISNATLHQTFLNMVGTDHLDARFVQRVKNIRYTSGGMTLNLAVSELPDFKFPKERLTGWFGVCPSWQYAEKAFYEYTIHEIPEKPLLFGYVPSYFDDTVAPPGKHVLHFFTYPLPYDLVKGNWDNRREEAYDRAVNVLAEYAPNVKKSIISRYAWTPLDLEREIGMTRGDWAHGTMVWDQMLAFRPPIGYTDYRTPIANLYLCGAGVHPGGTVMAAPGHNAAQIILADWKGGKVK